MSAARDPAQPRSLLGWIMESLGLPYAFLLLGAGLLCFLLALILVLRGRGPMAAASLILIVHLPLLIGIFGAVQGAIACYMTIAASGVAAKPAEVAAAISAVLMTPLVGLLMMVPGYATAALGGFIRALLAKTGADESSPGRLQR